MRRALATLFLFCAFPLLADDGTPDFHLDRVRESLTGVHRHYTQYIDGIEVVGGERIETLRAAGALDVEYEHASKRPAKSPGSIAAESTYTPPAGATRVYVDVNGEAQLAWRVVTEERKYERYAEYRDAQTGAVLKREPLFWTITAKARVFVTNPVVTLNDTTLRDRNNSAAAVPESAYTLVDLPDLEPAGPLTGPNVQIVQSEAPVTIAADASRPLLFDRSQLEFEDVNAYFHIDRNQRYLQSLGYVGVRRLVNYPIPVDPHAANGSDNSYYISSIVAGQGGLYFGDGGTDDAEDPDIMTHEFGHAIQDWIAPGTFGGSHEGFPRAIGEGFGDYWAFSSRYAPALANGRDPFCLADWDARCNGDDPTQQCGYSAQADCLRRVDSSKTMADYITLDAAGTEHQNGMIWASALREIYLANVARYGQSLGRRLTDTLVIEGTFGVPPSPSFTTMARKLLDADRLLYNGVHSDVICSAFAVRGIFVPAANCTRTPQGEITIAQSGTQGVAIPDFVTSGITATIEIDDPRAIDELYVDVDIEHTARGDLQLTLVAPDGTAVLLQNTTLDRTANLHATYGLDAIPVQSLDRFRGKQALGTWKLIVADVRPRDHGTLVSWSLIIKFAGDDPRTTRPTSQSARLVIPAVAHAPGALGTNFITDVHIFNASTTATAHLMAVFTPSGANGLTQFSAVQLAIPPGNVVELRDVVARTFRTVGTGQLELQGDVTFVTATSRTYTGALNGTYGQFVPAVSTASAASFGGAVLHVPQLEVSDVFRSNIGLAEVAGGNGIVELTIYDETGRTVSTNRMPLPPFTHLQLPVQDGPGVLRAELRVIGGDVRVLGYGSVVDNRTGDAVYIPALAPVGSIAWRVPAIHASGAFSTSWRTDLYLTNTTAKSLDLKLRDVPVTVPAGATRVFRDVVASAFGADGRMPLVVTGDDSGLFVTTRTWTDSPDGTYGQFAAAVRDEEVALFEDTLTVAGIDQTPTQRTNLGIISASDVAATVRVSALEADGRRVALLDLRLEAGGYLQLPLSAIVGSLQNGRVTVRAITPGARVYAYASQVDNVSGDPIYIPAH